MAPMRPLFLLLLLATSLTPALSSSSSSSSSTRSNDASTDFIRSSCGATLYPDLCFSSLAPYASTVQQSPLDLARAATTVALARLRSLSHHVSSLSSRLYSDARANAALDDCADSLGDAIDQAKHSAAQLAKLGAVQEGTKYAWALSNVQTWMSAALTNEDTCTDGFDGVRPTPVMDDVLRSVARSKQLSSNALALVNKLAY